MARISTYQLDDSLEFDDRVIGTDTSSNNATMNFSLEQLGEFYSRSGRAQSSITFTFDVGGSYSGTPVDVEAGHIYFNSASWGSLTEVVFSTTTNLGVGTQAFAGVIYDQAIAINQVGDERGEAYAFFDVADVNHEEIYVSGNLVGFRVGMQGFTHPGNHPNFAHYQGQLPTDHVSITPFGVADIVGTEQNLIYRVNLGELEITDGNTVEILGFDTSGVDPQIVFEGDRYSLGHSNLDIEGSSTITITQGAGQGEIDIAVASTVIQSIADAQADATQALTDAGAAQTTANAAQTAAAQAQIEVDAIEGDVMANTAARHAAVTVTNVTDPSSYTNAVVHDVQLVGQEIRITYEEDGINPDTPNQTLSFTQPITSSAGNTDGNTTIGFNASYLTTNAPNVTLHNVTTPGPTDVVSRLALDTSNPQQVNITYGAGSSGGGTPSEDPIFNNTSQPYSTSPHTFNITVTDRHNSGTVSYVVTAISPATSLVNPAFGAPSFSGNTITIGATGNQSGHHDYVVTLNGTYTPTDGSAAIAYPPVNRTLRVTIEDQIIPPPIDYYYGDLSSIAVLDPKIFLENSNAVFTGSGTNLVSGTMFTESVGTNNDDYIVVNIRNSVTTSPQFNIGSWRIALDPGEIVPDPGSSGFTTYYLPVPAGISTITISF